ncbi:DNA methyltransferase, partial [Providencia rettgeri]
VLIDSPGNLIAGHGRLLASRKLGLKQIPSVVADGLTDAQRKAYVIADNKLALNAGWDEDLLRIELQSLVDMDFNISLTGFDDDFIRDLLVEENAGLTDPEDTPSVDDINQPVTQSGDIWLLGKHRLMCGDSTSIDAISELCQENLVDMWLTDPPYNVAYEGKTKDALTIKNDEMGDADFRAFLAAAYSAADSIMKPGAVFYIWHADSEGYNFRGAARDIGWKIRQCLIWQKNGMVLGRQDYHWKHEPCLYGWKDGASHLWASDRKQT